MLEGREVVEGEVIVRYRAQSGRIERERAELQADSDVSEAIGRRGARRLRSNRLTTRQMLAELRANPDIELVEPNFIIRASAVPNDPSMSSLWGLINTGQTVDGQAGTPGADIDAAAAWDVTTGSRANVIAVIDSGIDVNHPDLAANLFTAPRPFSVTLGSTTVTCPAGSHGFNAIDNSCVVLNDENGHGTHVAGIIGAVGNNNVGVTGVNWTANVMAIKILGGDGTGSTSDAIKGIEFAIKAKAALGTDANVRVLNASWGGSAFSQALQEEIEAANSADMLFVVSAGSVGSNNDATPHYPASYPSSNVVSVAAADNRGALASYSNYGATSVHLAAPGASTLSTLPNNSYGVLSGTSMAAPHVAGAAALILSVCPSTTATLKSRLLASVDPDASLSGKTVSGGRLNVGAAIQQCAATLHATINGITITATVGNSPGNPVDWLGLYCPASNADGSYLDWKYLNGTKTAPSPGLTAATVTFQAPAQSGVACNVRLFWNNQFIKLGTSETVTPFYSPPSVSVTPTSVSPGGAFSASVANGPANTTDWLGLFAAGASNSQYTDWKYLNGDRTPPASGMSNATVPFTAPSTPGSYEMRWFSSNSYNVLATSNAFTVASMPAFTIGDVSITEGNSGTSLATFTVTLSPVNSSQTATVNYATANSTATSGSDYVAASGPLSFSPSVSTRTFTVTIQGDTFQENNETFFVNLSGATNAVIGDAQAIGTIITDDAPPGPSVTVSTPVVNYGAIISFNVANGPANPTDWVGLFDAAAPDNVYVQWWYLNGTKTAPASGIANASLQFTAPSTPGTYDVRLFINNSFTRIARSGTITVGPAVTVASTTVQPGALIQFQVANGPTNPRDWVGLYDAAAPDTAFIQWIYLNGTKTAPASGLANASLQFTAPSTPGTYDVRFFVNDGFTRIARSLAVTVAP